MTWPRIEEAAPLHELRKKRHENGRDLKIVVTQRDSGTGGGKSTLALWLALSWDDDWNADERATLHPSEFISTYPDLPAHSVLILDEAEELDARRSMSSENVNFSKQWMTMRTRQIDSILTLPTAGALDKRLLELADLRINVVRRGYARVYEVKVDDFNPDDVRQRHLHDIKWPDLGDHPEYEALEALKDEKIEAAAEQAEAAADGGTTDPKEAADQAKKEMQTQTVIKAVKPWDDDDGMTYREAADLIDYSHQWVGERVRQWKNGDYRRLVDAPSSSGDS